MTHTPPDDIISQAGPALHEMAQLLSSTTEWQSVKDAMVAAWEASGDQAVVVAAGRAGLARMGFDEESFTASIPAQYRDRAKPEELAQAFEAVTLLLIASAANEIVSGRPLPIVSFAGGHVSVEHVEQDGLVIPVVHVYATPFGDPKALATRFQDECYRAFGGEAFATREQGQRDAEWWRRHRNGETYRQIALADDRAELAPEARATPDEYPDEVNRATDRVRRAVKRFAARWTQKLDSMSKDEH